MTSLMDNYCQDDMLFSDVYHDQIPGLTADIQPHAFRVGSYTGSDCEQQYRSFPTPPDSPVFAELTPPNNSQSKAASTTAGAHMQQSTSMLPGDSGLLAAHNLDMNALLDSCLNTVYNNIPDHMDQFCDPIYQSELMQTQQNAFIKQEPHDAFASQSDMSMNWNFQPSFAESLEDYPVPSPTPSPQFDDIFTGDLKDLDRILNFGDQGLMHTLQTRPHMTYGHSAGEESDMDSGSEASFSLSVPDVPAFNTMHQHVTSTIPAAHHHHHHHHHHLQQQQQHQQQHHLHQQQQQQAYHSASRTHNYQCRTLHKTLETLGNHADGFIGQDPMTVQQQVGAIGPIRKQHRGRPRKRSVTSSDDGCSDEEQVVSTSGVSSGVTQSKRGRGRREAMKGNHLWEFIRDLLKSDSFCPKYIRWEDREAGVFRFVNSEAVANMWGRKKNNPQMTYEKLSRAMRYYYKREILERVDGRRLVYKFGKNADGWKEAAGLQ